MTSNVYDDLTRTPASEEIPWANVQVGDELRYMTFDSPWGMARVRRRVTEINWPIATLVQAIPGEGVWNDDGVYHIDLRKAKTVNRLAPTRYAELQPQETT